MPYIHMQLTRDGVTVEQKERLIKGVTDLLVQVLNKNPATTFVVIEEVETDNWGIAGMTITKYRQQEQASAQNSMN
jgi:4-oxalocrotonate tautomerase